MPSVRKKRFGIACPECGHEFRNAHDLARHTPQHNPALKEHLKTPCPYPQCDFSTLQKSNLDDHINTHTGAKPHRCREIGCAFRCANRSSLTRHHQECHEQKLKRRKAKRRSRERVPPNGAGTKTATKVRKTSLDTSALKDHRVEAEKGKPLYNERPNSKSIRQLTQSYAPYAVPGPYGGRSFFTRMPHAQVVPHFPVDVDPVYTPQGQQRISVGLCTMLDSNRATRRTSDTIDPAAAHAPRTQSCPFYRGTLDYKSSFSSSSVLDERNFSSLSSPSSIASYPDDDDEIGDMIESLDLNAHSEWHGEEEPIYPPPTSIPVLPLRYPPFSVKPHLSNLLNPE